MAQCVVCAKIDSSYSPLSSVCPNCGYNAFATNGPFTKFISKVDAAGTSKLLTDPIAAAILRLTPEGLAMTRVRPLLKLFLALHTCADWIANLVHLAPVMQRTARIQTLDNELRNMIGMQEVLGFVNYSNLCANKANVVQKCRQGWETVRSKWSELTEDKDRKALIAVTFEHDKGYPQSVDGALNFTKGGEADVAFVLLAWLNSDSGVNPFTGLGSMFKKTPSAWISEGWASANIQGRTLLFQLMTGALEEKLRIGDSDEFASLLESNRNDIVETLMSCMPRDAAESYVTKDAKAAYVSLFG
jgi:hypothetical protein